MSAQHVTTEPNTATSSGIKHDTLRLRILATTDIHMQLLGHDYVTDEPSENSGLAGIATLIKHARAEAAVCNIACVLLDNGDMIQGTIVGDMLAEHPVTDAHPLVACLNILKYDAIGLGNHDLDFGLPYLRELSRNLTMPLVSTNLALQNDNFVQKSALITCAAPTPDGGTADIKVGILSILPAKTAIWNRHVLQGQAAVAPALPCLQTAVAGLKSQGAQVIVLLAHMGISGSDTDQDDNALSYAQIPGIDAIVAGHTHRVFPGQDHRNITDVDAVNGTIAGRPSVMPGSAGSDLAVLDLTLAHNPRGGWAVAGHTSTLRANTSLTEPDPEIATLCAPSHNTTRTHLAQPVGRSATTIHNYFSLMMPTPIAALTARAKARVVRAQLAGSADANTPLLASVAAHTAGGRGGPNHFLRITQGAVLRRHIGGLSPYANQIWVVRLTGADLLAMLENTATIFNTPNPDAPDQPLINPAIPSFNFDTVFGVEYRIDPTQPPGARISKLMYQGRAVAPDDPFIMATNQFRAAGGGGVRPSACDAIVLRSKTNITDALIDTLAHPDDAVWPSLVPWSFACKDGIHARIRTSPHAIDHIVEAAHLQPEFIDITSDGFAEFRLTL